MTAVILAGGRSSRMGTPKALLPFDNEPLIVHLVRRLQPLFGSIVVVAAPGQALPQMPVSIVHDEVAHQGPVGGICYGLRAVQDDRAFVTSCDSAFLNTSLVAHLMSLLGEADVVVPRWGERLQPLVAVYRTSVVPVLERQLADGELRPVTLFERVRTRYVEEPEIRRFDPAGDSFFNMNRPEDYEEALRRWTPACVPCTVELFGVAQLLAGERQVPLTLPPGATLRNVFAALVARVPAIAGQVVAADGSLGEGYACSINGLSFVRSPDAPIAAGDAIVILSADAGG
jgi:molybdopterin-guanine dinucleotide biosynthesis protein A